jgi:hypothetical protein
MVTILQKLLVRIFGSSIQGQGEDLAGAIFIVALLIFVAGYVTLYVRRKIKGAKHGAIPKNRQ